jgi:hypothetical protein
VDYVWYKFIDQPAIQRLGLSDVERNKLQMFVESLHANSGVEGPTFAAPTSGTLAMIDPTQLVMPPTGFEVGYVPIVISQYKTVPEGEVNALTAFYNAAGGENWTNNTRWLSGDPDGWHGVTVENSRVTRLDLPENNLTGTISPEVGKLTSLEYVELSNNHLTGSLPSEIGELRTLNLFATYNNKLNGTIPVEFGNLTELTLLQLGSNELSGSLPEELGQLTNLKYLFIEDNAISGPLPLTLQNLDALMSFTFQGTQLCVPTDESLQIWLQAIPNLVSTDIDCVVTSTAPVTSEANGRFSMNQSYPNPFSASTMISFDLPETSFVSLKIFDQMGRESATLFFGTLPAGKYSKQWSADNWPDGLYFFHLQAGSYTETRKVILLR